MAIFKSRQKSSSASLQTKTATADTDDIVILPDTGYDGMSTVTVHPTPSEAKTVTATTSSQTVTPTSGKFISEVTVEPQAHTTTYTPSEDTASNDMGANHDYRYVNTSGMVIPSGRKLITQNGTEDVTNYASVNVQVSSSPNMIHPNNESPAAMVRSNVYEADANGYAIASYSSVTPQPAPRPVSSGDIVKFEDSGIILDEYPTPNMQDKTVTATTSGQLVEPDSGYDGLYSVVVNPQVHTATYVPDEDTAQNDMDDIHNYRYVNTSGMVRPSSITPSNNTPASLTSGSAVTPTANGYAIESYSNVTPSNSSPAVVGRGFVYSIQNDNGYVIKSYSDVTPSNSTPVALTSGDIAKLGGNGYAIESYSLANPEEGTRMTSGNFYKPTDNGLIIDDIKSLIAGSGTDDTIEDGKNYHAVGGGIAIQGYASITPSNSSPVSLSSGNYYKPTASGKAVASITSITPSDSSPASLSTGTIYTASTSGYAIKSSPASKTPSDSSPASVSSDQVIKAASSGYLYKSSGLGKCKAGTGTASASANTKITLGFKPKYLCVLNSSALNTRTLVYDETMSTTKFSMATSSSNCTIYDLGTTSQFRIYSIDNDGFTLTKWNDNTIHYFAVG